jgi:glucosamine--fructose-6-phosphate aminotransferase (isomerizing)
MCGIVGIVGSEPVAERLLAGLKRLEYRGYDSAGLAVIGAEGALERRRAAGKLDNLQTLMDQSPIDGVTGIAHTRWATHGKPNQTNAHPHTVGPIAIIHNGIIENFSEIKAELEARGRTFETETDSETVAHLIAQGIDDGASMTEAFQAALKRLRGAYAIVAVCELEPDRLWAARSGSPLVVGIGDGEAFLGSDAIALAGWTRHVIYLEEGDWVVAGPDGARVFDEGGREVAREVHVSNAVAGFADKGEYRHFMEKEIHEQPDAVSRTLSGFVDASERRFLSSTVHDWAGTGRLLTSACGTALLRAVGCEILV